MRLLGGLTVRVARPALTVGGASAVVLDLDSLSGPAAPTLEDVLRTMPLIQVRRNSRGEAQPALRGSDDRQVAVLMDGVPLTLGWDHRTDLSIVPVTAARQVTLVRGLSSVLYGPNTLGGIVEVDVAGAESREASVDPLSFGGTLDDEGGTAVSVTGGRLLRGAGGQWTLRAGLGIEDRPGSPLAAGVARDPEVRARYLGEGGLRLNSDVRRADAFAVARYRSLGGSWASLSAAASDAERGVPPEAHQEAPRFWRYPEQRRLIAAVSGGSGQRDTGLGEGDVEASLGVDLGTTLIEQFTSESFQVVDGTESADDRVLTLRLLADHTLGRRGDLRTAVTLADIQHEEVLQPGGPNEYRQRLWSFGAETLWRLDSAARTTLAVGAALDGADTPESGDKPPLGALTDWGVRLGVSSLVRPGLLVHAGASRRARFPSLRELYSAALGRFEPNPSLRAETLLGAEAGMTWQQPWGEVQAVAFLQGLDDGIVRRSVIGSDGTPRFQRVNRAEVRSLGAELLAAAAVGRAALSADLTLQEVTGIDAAGTSVPVEYEPELFGRVRVEAPVWSDVVVGVQGRFVGAQWCENPERGGLERLASHGFGDASVRRAFTLGPGGPLRRLEVTAAMSNFTDAVAFGQCGLPEPGRLFRLQLRVW